MNKIMKFGSWLILIIALGLIATASQIELKTSGGASFPGSVNSSSYMKATNFTCTNCISLTQVKDIYLQYIGGTMTGNIKMGERDIYNATDVNTTHVHATTLYGALSGTFSPTGNTNFGAYDIYGTGWSNFTNTKVTNLYATNLESALDGTGFIITAANFSCTDCLGATQIEDIYALTVGDTFTGTVTIDQNADAKGLYIDSEATTSTNYGLQVDTVSAAKGIFVNQDGSGYGIEIDSESATAAGMYINVAATKAVALFGDYSGNPTHQLYRNVNAGNSTGSVVLIEQDNVADDQAALVVQQDGTAGAGVYVQMMGESSTGSAFTFVRVDNGAQYTTMSLGNNRASTDGSFYFNRNLNSTYTAGPVMYILQDNVLDDQDALYIHTDSTNAAADGLSIDADGPNSINIIDGNIKMGEQGIYNATWLNSTKVYASTWLAGEWRPSTSVTTSWLTSTRLRMGDTSTSPSIQREEASSTNPVFTPNDYDSATGIGWTAGKKLSLIANSTELIRLASQDGGNVSIMKNVDMNGKDIKDAGWVNTTSIAVTNLYPTKIMQNVNVTTKNMTDVKCIIFQSGGKICSGV